MYCKRIRDLREDNDIKQAEIAKLLNTKKFYLIQIKFKIFLSLQMSKISLLFFKI